MNHNIKYYVQKLMLEGLLFTLLLYTNFFLPIIGSSSMLFIIVFSLTFNFKTNFNIFILLISLLTDILCENKIGMHIAISLFIIYEIKSEKNTNKKFSDLFISFFIFSSVWLFLNIIMIDNSKIHMLYIVENYITGVIFFPFINYLICIIKKKIVLN